MHSKGKVTWLFNKFKSILHNPDRTEVSLQRLVKNIETHLQMDDSAKKVHDESGDIVPSPTGLVISQSSSSSSVPSNNTCK